MKKKGILKEYLDISNFQIPRWLEGLRNLARKRYSLTRQNIYSHFGKLLVIV